MNTGIVKKCLPSDCLKCVFLEKECEYSNSQKYVTSDCLKCVFLEKECEHSTSEKEAFHFTCFYIFSYMIIEMQLLTAK